LAQLVQHRSADTLDGVGFELRALGIVEVLGRVQQPQQPGLDEIVDLDAGRQPRQ
jgi:hypothetical protein